MIDLCKGDCSLVIVNHFNMIKILHKVFGWQNLGTWIWIWIIKIRILCLDSLQRVEDLDLTDLSEILNLKIIEFE